MKTLRAYSTESGTIFVNDDFRYSCHQEDDRIVFYEDEHGLFCTNNKRVYLKPFIGAYDIAPDVKEVEVDLGYRKLSVFATINSGTSFPTVKTVKKLRYDSFIRKYPLKALRKMFQDDQLIIGTYHRRQDGVVLVIPKKQEQCNPNRVVPLSVLKDTFGVQMKFFAEKQSVPISCHLNHLMTLSTGQPRNILSKDTIIYEMEDGYVLAGESKEAELFLHLPEPQEDPEPWRLSKESENLLIQTLQTVLKSNEQLSTEVKTLQRTVAHLQVEIENLRSRVHTVVEDEEEETRCPIGSFDPDSIKFE